MEEIKEVSIYLDSTGLVIEYPDVSGDLRNIVVEMDKRKQELTQQVLGMGDFWTAFLGGLSNAVDQVKRTANG